MLLKDEFERFFNRMAHYKQPAGKNYSVDILKHIGLKMINQAVKGKGRIVVFGDKDPDGIFSSMIMQIYLERLMAVYREKAFSNNEIGVDIRYSNREKDGFGLSHNTYKELSKAYSLIITTDNGTSSDFHSKEIDNLIVIDHHPLNEGQTLPTDLPYLLNPNLNRTDGLEYSTSGGMVAYDIVRFMDRVLREQNAHYQNYLKNPDNSFTHTFLLEVLKEYASFTLVSDMAILDYNNRRFVAEGLKTAFLKSDKVPLYSMFEGEFSQQKFSFGVAPKINIDRKGELHTIDPKTNKTYMESFVCPKTLRDHKQAQHFIDAKDFILKVDKERKAYVRKVIFQKTETLNHNDPVHLLFIDDPEAKVGLGGLVAGKIANKYGKPCIVAIATTSKDKLSFSGRGENVKSILSKILASAGGHQNASGGAEPIPKDSSALEVFHKVKERLSHITDFPASEKKEIIHTPLSPLSFKEAMTFGDLYHTLGSNVEVFKSLQVAVQSPKLFAHHLYASGWGRLSFGEKDKHKEILFDSFEYSVEDIKSAEYVIFKLVANGDMSLEAIYQDKESYLDNVVQLEEAQAFNLGSAQNSIEKETLPTILSSDMAHRYTPDVLADNIYYYDAEDEELEIFDHIVEDGLIVAPSYVNAKHFASKRSDVLEFFAGMDENTPLSASDMAGAYSAFAKRLLSASKSKEIIFMPKGLLNHSLISENGRNVLQKIIKSASHIKEGGKHEEQSIRTTAIGNA